MLDWLTRRPLFFVQTDAVAPEDLPYARKVVMFMNSLVVALTLLFSLKLGRHVAHRYGDRIAGFFSRITRVQNLLHRKAA